jgi:putative intracellular protease/amidase
LRIADEEVHVADASGARVRFAGSDEFAAQSMPTAAPEGPTVRAMRSVVSPNPQPTSSTRAPGRWSQRASATSLCCDKPSMSRWRKRQNLSNSTVFQACTITLSLVAMTTLLDGRAGRARNERRYAEAQHRRY